VDKIIIATLFFLSSFVGCTNSAFALFDGDSGNVGTDWTNTFKDLHTTGSGTFDNDLTVGDDTSITGDLTASGVITLNTTKFNSKTFRSDYDYSSLAVAFSSIGAVTPTRLSICQDNIVADGTTLTQTSNIVLDFTCGGSIAGIAGGGTETLVLNGPINAGLHRIFGSNLVVSGTAPGPVSPKWFGAKCDGTTDDGAIINTALSYKEGAQVWIEDETCATSITIEIPSGAELKGIGGGQYPTPANYASANFLAVPKSRIVALAGFTASAPVIRVKTTDAAAYAKESVSVKGLMIDCAGIADYGIDVISVKRSKFKNLLVYRPLLVGIRENVLSGASTVTEGNNATQFNVWESVTVWAARSADSTTTIGWQQIGTELHDCNEGTYTNIVIVTIHGDALQVQGGGNNTWIGMYTYTYGKGVAVRLYGRDVATGASVAKNNTFIKPDLGGASHTGTAQAGGASTITLDATASTDDLQYEGRNIKITGTGTGAGQQRNISSYDGATKIATVSEAWTTQPDNTSAYTVYTGGVVAESGTNMSSFDNIMYSYIGANGASEPIIESGVRFTYTMAGGASYGWRRFTPAVTFITPGDLSVTYAYAEGRYWRTGHTIKFIINITFTPTFTTASGSILITGLPYLAKNDDSGAPGVYAASVHYSNNAWSWGASKTQISARVLPGVDSVRLIGMGNGVNAAYITTTEMPSGTEKTIHISGEYEAGA
jgi:hypothetical protein